MIEVHSTGEETYSVNVIAAENTNHEVMLEDWYYMKLTDGQILPEELIERSFEFLLERESGAEIMEIFDLCLIQNNFPEYEKTMKRELRKKI
ncbi:MAG: hypothetical protein AAF558_14105 [Verrucomicrobiota bacterium]